MNFKVGASSLVGCKAVALTVSGSNRQARCTTSALLVGLHNLSATYSGDAGSAGSNSSNLGITVTPAPLTVTA